MTPDILNGVIRRTPSAFAGVTILLVGPGIRDHSPNGVTEQARHLGFPVDIAEYRLVHLLGADHGGVLSSHDGEVLAQKLLATSVGQWCIPAEEWEAEPDEIVVDVCPRPGVTDRAGRELVRAAAEIGVHLVDAVVGRRYVVSGPPVDVDKLADLVLHNDVVERWAPEALTPAFADQAAAPPATVWYDVAAMAANELVAVSTERRLGLSAAEMEAVADHARSLGRPLSDAELEMIAQTWSEHCSHKTFRATITTDQGEQIDGLMPTYLRAATDAINAPWVRSAFVDNAGIVRFDDHYDLAIKAETHNHPSALEPFGGANTGVGGVVRDILGVSAKPVAITDVLCFGPDDLPMADVPHGVLHPRRVRAGVIAGVGDYGNKIGVPTLAGAIVHHPAYTTTPLVFAGCVGVLPTGSHPTQPQPGDAIVVLGGAVGRDGIGGATFSSQTMGTHTAQDAGSSVQIGDPVTEKCLIDVVVAARDAQLYSAITDCGAGGLSSAVGEMAEGLGARVELAQVPRKYPGLSPWEVWLSEAQERMVMACPAPDKVLELAQRWGVEATVIGSFAADNRLVVTDAGHPVIDLDLKFVHDGRPPLFLSAVMPSVVRPPRTPIAAALDPHTLLLRLLAHPSIRSNEAVVRTFDHEVLGATLTRPYGGVNGDCPADGTVFAPVSGVEPHENAAVLGIGLSVLVGQYDPEAMAWLAFDEAVANAVASGADPDQLSVLDNFSWGDPTDPSTLGELVATCRGCHDAALAYGAPFVSGKDSLFNVFVDEHGEPDPVAATLVITAIGVADVGKLPAVGAVREGNDVWLVGPLSGALGGSHLDDVVGGDLGGPVPAPDPSAIERHRSVHAAITDGLVFSAHDISHGGVAVAASEWLLGGELGMEIEVPTDIAGRDGDRHAGFLFGEGPGRYLVEVDPSQGQRFAQLVPSATRIGCLTSEPLLVVQASDRGDLGDVLRIRLDQIRQAWSGRS